MANKEYRIIGRLYHDCIKPMHIVSSVDEYFDLILMVPCNTPTQSGILQYDYFTTNALIDFKEKLIHQDAFINNLDKYFSELSMNQKNNINDKLKDIANSVVNYSNFVIRSPKDYSNDKMENYDSRERTKLSSYYSAKSETYNLSYNVFLLIYLAVYKRLPSNFFFGINYQQDLDEFNEEVTCKYGVTSKPGIRAIISLAERGSNGDSSAPNLFALYEYADMLYYGSENGPTKNINTAFKTYKMISSTNNNSPCHPLAQWTLAYIFYNYHQPKTELENCDPIPEIEGMPRLEQLKEAIRYAKYAYDLVKNPAAANILGKICSISESEINGIEESKKEANLKSAEEYFQSAADQNYIYAYASLANLHLENIFDDPVHQTEHLEQYILTLKKQADQYEPWAANKLGLFYLNGEIESRKTKEKLIFKDYIDRTRSFLFFSQATSYFNDTNSGWAYANMIINFPKKYIGDEELTTLKQHLERLKNIGNSGAIQYVLNNFIDTYSPFESEESCKSLLSIIQQ